MFASRDFYLRILRALNKQCDMAAGFGSRAGTVPGLPFLADSALDHFHLAIARVVQFWDF